MENGRAVILRIHELSGIGDKLPEYQRVRGKSDKRNEGIEKLGENVWLIPLPQGLPFLGKMVSIADFASLKYDLMYIEHEAVWVNYHEGTVTVSEEDQS